MPSKTETAREDRVDAIDQHFGSGANNHNNIITITALLNVMQ